MGLIDLAESFLSFPVAALRSWGHALNYSAKPESCLQLQELIYLYHFIDVDNILYQQTRHVGVQTASSISLRSHSLTIALAPIGFVSTQSSHNPTPLKHTRRTSPLTRRCTFAAPLRRRSCGLACTGFLGGQLLSSSQKGRAFR